MRVLKLCTSDEFAGDLPEEARAYRVAERLITGETGEAVETTLREIWPEATLPELLDRWVERYQPDLVLLVVSAYWFTFESIPLRLEHKFGWLGRRIGKLAERSVAADGVGSRAGVVWARRFARRVIGAEANFTTDQVIQRMEASIQALLRHEDLSVVVRAPTVPLVPERDRRSRTRGEARMIEVDQAMRTLCRRLHLEYVTREEADPTAGDSGQFQRDFVHTNGQAHANRGNAEGAALVRAWRQMHRDHAATPLSRITAS
jgi:hypothetical protein